MSYHHRTKHYEFSSNRFVLKRALVIFIILFLLEFVFGHSLSSIVQKISAPIFKTSYILRSALNVGPSVTSKKSLYSENGRLTKELEEASLVIADLKNQLAQNEIYRQLVEGAKTSSKLMWAEVVAYPGIVPYDIFIARTKDASMIKVGSRVFSDGNIPLGEVSSIDGKVVHVSLYSSAGNVFEGKIGDNLVQIEGRGGGNFMTKFPKGIPIKLGDAVYVKNIASPIALVAEIETAPADTFETAYFRLTKNIFKTQWIKIEQ